MAYLPYRLRRRSLVCTYTRKEERGQENVPCRVQARVDVLHSHRYRVYRRIGLEGYEIGGGGLGHGDLLTVVVGMAGD